jgi:TonB-dependent starch-binding outer membrane protein SusC
MKQKLLFTLSLIMMVVSQAWAQSRTVTGKVTDAVSGQGLPGVTVMAKGTQVGTSTDVNGAFSLNVPAGATTLVASFIGYGKLEKAIGTGNTVQFTLSPDVRAIEEVIVTGYRNVDASKSSASATAIKAVAMEQVPMASFDQVLQGRAPGLLVTAGSGQPGTGARVRIRGSGSINASSTPLYILDGVPIDAAVFATLNPNDFDNVTVLKDASATAIYGARAANGVLVITSKQGKEGPTKIQYRFQQGISTIGKANFDMMNTEEKLAIEYRVKGGAGWTQRNNPAELARLRTINTDWSEVFFRTGKTQSHEINASGGSAGTKFYLSANYFDQQGIAPRSDLKRYTARINVTTKASDKLRFGINNTLGFSQRNFIESESAIALANPFAAAYMANPYTRPRNPETGALEVGTGQIGPNALERIETILVPNNQIKSVGNIFGEFDVLKGLTLRSSLGLDYTQDETTRFIPPGTIAGTAATGQQGSLNRGFSKTTQLISTTTLAYKATLGEDHDVNAIVGNEVLKRNFNAFSYTGYGINPRLTEPTPAAITAGTTTNGFIPALGGSNTDNALVSLFSNVGYTFKDRYNLDLGLRRDGSSRFGANHRYATFYSVGGSWNLTNESFAASLTALSNLKLRASYGTRGNQEGIGNFQSLAQIGTTSYMGVNGQAPSNVPDPDLKWEVSNVTNLGVDYGLFNNRISGSVDVYNNLTSDLFITSQISRVTGFTSLQRNAGKMQNRGIEVALNTENLNWNGLTWSTNINFTYNKNEILDLGQVSEFEQGTSIIREGLPLGSHYAVGFARVNPETGAPIYLDKNGKETETFSAANNTANWGTFEPPYFGGITNNFGYKGFTVSALFTFAAGHRIYNNQSYFLEQAAATNGAGVYNQARIVNTMWTTPGQITRVHSSNFARQFSSYDIQDGDFLRFRNLTVSYDVAKNLVQRVKLGGVRVYLQGQNLATFTNSTVFDPEESNNISQFDYPAPRIYTFGVDVSF